MCGHTLRVGSGRARPESKKDQLDNLYGRGNGAGNPVHLPSPSPYPTSVLTNLNLRYQLIQQESGCALSGVVCKIAPKRTTSSPYHYC